MCAVLRPNALSSAEGDDPENRDTTSRESQDEEGVVRL